MKSRILSTLLSIGLTLTTAIAMAQAPFYLRDGDRVVFYGDSITDQRLYTVFTEAYVVTRFPKMNVKFIHSGWGGDRVTGGGGGPIDLRLKRDVFAYKPTVMTIMLGMNDGSYRPFDQGIFDTYANGYQHIVQSVKETLPGIRMTLIQPSPYDDVTRAPGFADGYNAVLVRYGQYLKELAQREKLDVADLNTSVVAALVKAKELDTTPPPPNQMPLSQRLVPDRVHPSASGHLLMAEALLKAWNAPSVVSAVEIDAGSKKITRTENTRLTDLTGTDSLMWTQHDNALPLPFDMNDAPTMLAVAASDVVQALDQQPLKVTGLSGDRYTLKIDGVDVGTFTSLELASGINLAVLPTPMRKQAMDVFALTVKHNNLHFMRWRNLQVPMQNDNLPSMQKALDGLDAVENDIVKQQRAAALPKPHRFELVKQ